MEFDEYVLVRLIRTPDRPSLDPADEDRIQDAHLAHIHALWARGMLLAAGPAGSDDDDVVGMSILRGSLDEVRATCEDDPGYRAGRFTAQLTSWIVPAGMLAAGPGAPPAGIAEARS